MFHGNRRNQVRVPSPDKRAVEYLEPLDTEFPVLSNSFFPEYSTSHPGFENPSAVTNDRVDNDDGAFKITTNAKYAGTPSTIAMSPQYSYYSSGEEADKNTPLSLLADETSSSDHDMPTVQHPSQFPWLSPQPRTMVRVYETPNGAISDDFKDNNNNNNNNNKGSETKSQAYDKRRAGMILALVVSLLITVIVLATHLAKPSANSSNGTANVSTGTVIGTIPGWNINGPPKEFATPRPTMTLQPSTAPRPTLAPTLATPAPSIAPTTRPPTLKTNHPLLGVLQGYVPRDQLLDPNTPQGEALIWLATSDALNTTSQSRLVQRYAMTVLDVALHAPAPRLWSNRNLHECNWTGVLCNEQRQITKINWARQELMGTVPAELGLLTSLESLDIAQNQLKGNLEPLYELDKLEHAFLFENMLTGTLSHNISNLQNLTKFMAGHNQLSGSIPSNLKMRPLRELYTCSTYIYYSYFA